MSYGRSFGMRSFENIVRDGRFRTPAGSNWEIGTPVMLDGADPGKLKLATSAVVPGPNCGVAIFEHIQHPGVDPLLTTSSDLHTIPALRYCQMVHGPGAKVWIRNAPDKTLYDGRTQDNGALLLGSLDVTTLVPGDELTPNGDGTFKKATVAGTGWLTVEQVNTSTLLVEARFKF